MAKGDDESLPNFPFRCFTHRSALAAFAGPKRLVIVRPNWPLRESMALWLPLRLGRLVIGDPRLQCLHFRLHARERGIE